MRVLAIIPARLNSSRFPRKVLQDINGKSMLQRVYEGVMSCDLVTDVYIATDSSEVMAEIVKFGGTGLFTMGEYNNGTERCYAASLEIAQRTISHYDMIINIQGDQPLIHADHINKVIKGFESADPMTMVTCAFLTNDLTILNDRSNCFITVNYHSYAMYFCRYPIPYATYSRFTQNIYYYKHIGIYGYSPTALKVYANLAVSKHERYERLEQMRWLDNDFKVKVEVSEYPTVGVDTEKDIIKVKYKLGFEK